MPTSAEVKRRTDPWHVDGASRPDCANTRPTWRDTAGAGSIIETVLRSASAATIDSMSGGPTGSVYIPVPKYLHRVAASDAGHAASSSAVDGVSSCPSSIKSTSPTQGSSRTVTSLRNGTLANCSAGWRMSPVWPGRPRVPSVVSMAAGLTAGSIPTTGTSGNVSRR